TVVCWGYNGNGELGDGSLVDRSTPVRVMGLDGVVQVVVGGAHACALRADGTLWCWGLGTSGQLGNGTMTGSPTPVQAAWACHCRAAASMLDGQRAVIGHRGVVVMGK